MPKRQRDDRRAQGLLHVSLNCIYLQSKGNLILSLGQPYLEYEAYKSVLSKQDLFRDTSKDI